MSHIFKVSGISKQCFHQWLDRSSVRKEEQMHLLPIIRQIRGDHPRLSCREIYRMLKPKTMGRDRFESFCFINGFKVDVVRNKFKTTDQLGLIRFPNLLFETRELTGINQVWVSDITYYFLKNEVYYLTFIMDLYSRKIVGYAASKTLFTTETTLPALNMALRGRSLTPGLIFHSDGGGQYYCKAFLELTSKHKMKNSMGRTAYENPHAERVNGTIKNDYLIPYQPSSYNELQSHLKKAVDLYNSKRPHKSLHRLSPEAFEALSKAGLSNDIWKVEKRTYTTEEDKIRLTNQSLIKNGQRHSGMVKSLIPNL
jgi:hypothetical protein